MFIVAGASAHSAFKQAQLLSRLSSIDTVQSVESQWVYLFDQALNDETLQSANALLNDSQIFALRQTENDEVRTVIRQYIA